MSATPQPGIPRRHDLDALRAGAMLLGIALHAALSFTGYPWAVEDLRTSPLFGLLFVSIHGFRMPLFILVSGYFTMMLWCRRGLRALLLQRFQRVLVPCLLGVVTIVPSLRWVSFKANERAVARDARHKPAGPGRSELAEAVKTRDLASLERQLAGGADPNQADPEFGVPALGWAALYGEAGAARLLLEYKADVNVIDKGGYRPLHSAAFLGHFEVVDLLLAHGANPNVRGGLGDRPAESAQADWATTKSIADSLRIPLRSEEELWTGRAECRRLLARRTGIRDYQPATPGAGSSVLTRTRQAYAGWLSSEFFLIHWSPWHAPIHLFLTPIFDHLWFLWFLCWLVAGFALLVVLAGKFPRLRLPHRLVTSPYRWLWLVPLTMLPQLLMGIFVPGFGPDTSVGLLPQPHLLCYYGLFFGFGALYFDCDDDSVGLGRRWWLTLPLALAIALPWGVLTIGQPVLSGIPQVIYAWAMTFGLIGLFRSWLTGESPVIRYLSDSAYWLYLAHLPLVIAAQGWVRDWEVSPFIKFTLICISVTAFLLLTYATLIRYSWLGRLLNGPRTRSGDTVPVAAVEAPAS